MNLSKLKRMCKNERQIMLYNISGDDGITRQWLGTGKAIYLIQSLPHLDITSICTMFDFDIEEFLTGYSDKSKKLCFDDMTQNEIQIDYFKFKFYIHNGKNVLKPIFTSKGIMFIDTSDLLPINTDIDDYTFYERKNPDGNIYIAIKHGYCLEAIVAPRVVSLDEDLVEELDDMVYGLKHYISNETSSDHAKEEVDQLYFIELVDKETGEIYKSDIK